VSRHSQRPRRAFGPRSQNRGRNHQRHDFGILRSPQHCDRRVLDADEPPGLIAALAFGPQRVGDGGNR
jgi:hypothetical protein